MHKIIPLSFTALLLASCSLIPEYTRPVVETPMLWSENAAIQKPSDIAYDWWKTFNSDELNDLMNQALANNTDILAGIRRIEQARASLKIAGASLIPSVNASGGASRSKSNPASGNTSYSSSLNAGVNASYELDLFGANRANITAAEAGLLGSVYNQESLKLALMGDVATGYFTLVNLRERLAVADSNLKNAREVLRIIEARVREGSESELQLSQQRSSVASNEAARASIVQNITNAENALAVLLGKTPQSLAVKRTKLDGLSVPKIAAGQPSSLLERRPDLRQAEAALQAANANIGAARAAFFPSVSLGVNNSISLAGFGDPSATALSLAASISAPIFQGGRLQGGLDQATARQLELVENYRGNVLRAFQEVEDAMAAVTAARQRETSLRLSMNEARRAYQLSQKLYDAGSIDYQTLLNTQNAQLSAEDSFAQSRLARLTAAVNLYRTLGGGWVSVN